MTTSTLSPPQVPPARAATHKKPTGPDSGHVDRIVLVVTGCAGLLLSLSLSAVGSALLGVEVASRDPAGLVMSGEDHFSTDTYALVSESFTLHSDAPTVMAPETLVGDAEVQVTSTGSTPIFVGVARTSDVADYLAGMRHAEVVDLAADDSVRGEPVYDVTGATAPATLPGDLDIWSAQASGSGTVSLVWPDDEGEWTLVVMNADGSREVAADIAVGGSVPWLGWASGALLVGGTIGVLLALATLYVATQAGAASDSVGAFGKVDA